MRRHREEKSATSTRAKKLSASRILEYFMLMLVACIYILPISWGVLTSLKTHSQIAGPSPVLFFAPTLQNYVDLFEKYDFLLWLMNSAVVATTTTLIDIGLGVVTAYVIARFNFRGKQNFAFWILSFRFMPAVAVVFPLFVLFGYLKLLDTLVGLIVAYVPFTLTFSIWLLNGFIEEIPGELDEAALVDGCSRLGMLRRIIVPILKGGILVTAIFTFFLCWNEFLIALIITRQTTRTMAVGYTMFVTAQQIFWGDMFAAVTITLIPVIVFMWVLQKHITSGLTLGAVKG